VVSVDSCKTGSIRKQSVTNSKYQRRRLSSQKFEDDLESPEGDGKYKEKDDSAVAGFFFVNDVSIKVDLELETPNIVAEGRISEEPMGFSTSSDQQKLRSDRTFNKNSAFVEPRDLSDF